MISIGPTTRPIGIDLGSRMIRAAQLGREGEVLATAQIRRQKPDVPYIAEEFERLSGVLYRRGFWGRNLVVAAPKAIIQYASIDLPPRNSGAPIIEIARSELARQNHIDPTSFEFAWWDAPQPPRHGAAIRAMAISCTHQKANELLDAIEQPGFNTLALFSPSTAIAAASPVPGSGNTAGVLDLGWTDATFVVRSRDNIIYERRLSGCGLAGAIRSVSAKRRIDPQHLARTLEHSDDADRSPAPEAAELKAAFFHNLREEISSSIEYLRGCNGSPEPACITLLGGGALFPGIADAITQATDVPTHTAPGPHGPDMAAVLALAAPRERFEIEEAA